MNVLVLGGCGIQGKGALFDLSKNPFVDRIICADLDPERIHSVNYIQHDRIIPVHLNAMDKPAMISLMKQGVDVVIDLLPSQFVRTVAEAAIEAGIRGRTAAERLAARAEQAIPLLGDLKTAMETAFSRGSRKGSLGQAIRYALTRWPALLRYTTDGRLDMTNNAAERAIRPIAIGRKNWTFAGSDDGGRRAAMMYTLIETAKLNGVEPEAYLRAVIGRIAAHPIKRIAELLPWNIKL